MMMMMSSAVNKQSNLHQLSAMGNAKKPTEAHKHEASAPKLDLVDAKEDSFEFSSSPREAVADAPPTPAGDTLSLSTPTAVGPPAPAKPSMLAIGAGILAAAASVGAIYLGFENGKLGEKVTDLGKKVDVAEAAKKVADDAHKLAKEAGDKLPSLVDSLEAQRKAIVGAVTGDSTHAVEIFLKDQETNGVQSTNLTHLLEAVEKGTTTEIANVFDRTLKLIPIALRQTTTNQKLNPEVVNEVKVMEALLQVKAHLPKLPPTGADAATVTAYETAFNKAVDDHGADLAGVCQYRVKMLSNAKTDKGLNQELAQVFNERLSELEALKAKSISPSGTELAYHRHSDEAFSITKTRILNAPKAGEAVSEAVANAIVSQQEFRTDLDLLKHLVDTLANANSPLAKTVFNINGNNVNAVDYYLPRLISAGTQFSSSITEPTHGKASSDLAAKFGRVLTELNESKVVGTNLSGFGKAGERDFELLTKHHDGKLTTTEQLQYIQAQLTAIKNAVVVPPTPAPYVVVPPTPAP